MSLGDYLRGQQGRLLLHAAAMLALSGFLVLTGTAPGVVALVLAVWVPGLCLATGLAYRREKRQIDEMWAILEGLPQKYLFMECAPKPGDPVQRQWYEVLRRAGRSMVEGVSAAQRQQREYREYIENWVHEIKVPITAIQLMCQNDRTDTTRKILPQLAQIEEQVERSLYYARSGQIERDFVIRETALAEVAAAALEKYRTLLIQSGVRVDTEGLEEVRVYSDGKWLEFILGQLLSNAIKYRSEAESPLFTLAARRDAAGATLTLTDNGIGIPAEELPRIFDKGFTGSNGRARGGATGMGLYLCQKLAAHLGTGITVQSSPGATCFALHFPAGGPAV